MKIRLFIFLSIAIIVTFFGLNRFESKKKIQSLLYPHVRMAMPKPLLLRSSGIQIKELLEAAGLDAGLIVEIQALDRPSALAAIQERKLDVFLVSEADKAKNQQLLYSSKPIFTEKFHIAYSDLKKNKIKLSNFNKYKALLPVEMYDSEELLTRLPTNTVIEKSWQSVITKVRTPAADYFIAPSIFLTFDKSELPQDIVLDESVFHAIHLYFAVYPEFKEHLEKLENSYFKMITNPDLLKPFELAKPFLPNF